ncbi:hypothetical protein ACIRRA_45910 [Nocardia sp. NPDC101769]|uniref:hypothetical protein n=1 Tax=Nocardia sp. NPDC101769 TaxID=3364333 RepID=UPI0037F7D7D7
MSTDNETRIDAITFDLAEALPAENFPGPEAIPAEGILVSRSVKWSTTTDDAIKAAAKSKGITASELIRQYVVMGLAEEKRGLVVDLADLVRVLHTVAHPPAA